MVEDPPIVRLVNQIIEQAIADGASDIHVEPQQQSLQVRYRIDGILHDVMALPLVVARAIVSRIKIIATVDIAERRIPQDGRTHLVVAGKEYDLRISTLPTVFGEGAVMRILDQSQARVGLSNLGFAATMLPAWEDLISKPYGMILVSGPTGSGKSTTLYATLNKLNTADKKVLTIEDPVEYQLPRVNQVQVNPKAGLSFAGGLRAFLRQDPDIIMVGGKGPRQRRFASRRWPRECARSAKTGSSKSWKAKPRSTSCSGSSSWRARTSRGAIE